MIRKCDSRAYLIALFALCASPRATFALVDIDKSRQSLRESARATDFDVSRLRGSALDPQKISVLRDLADQSERDAYAADQAGQDIARQCRADQDFISGRFNTDPIAAFDRKTLSDKLDDAQKRLGKIKDALMFLRQQAAADSSGRLNSTVDFMTDRVNRADKDIRDASDNFDLMTQERKKLKDIYRQLSSLFDDITRSSQLISKNSSGLHASGEEAKARIDGLTDDAQTRTRAGMSINDMVGESRDIFTASDILFNRSDDYQRYDRSFWASMDRFDKAYKIFAPAIEDASSALHDAERYSQ